MLYLPEMSSFSQLEVDDSHLKSEMESAVRDGDDTILFDPLGIEIDSVKPGINSHRVPSIWSIGPDMFSMKRARIRRSS